jgi:taurine dioxygenase
MPLQIEGKGAPLGHHILGVDIAAGLDDRTFNEIEAAWDKYGVVVIPGQKLTPEQQIAFSKRFGEQEQYLLGEFLLPGHPEIFVVSNVVENGKPIGMADAGRTWHSDMTVIAAPPRGSILYALEVPRDADGTARGDTFFASSQAAYDALPAATKNRIDGLKAVFSYNHYIKIREQRAITGTGTSNSAKVHATQKDAYPDRQHPLVRVHPRTGRKCLYLAEELVSGIVGMDDSEAQKLLTDLWAHMTRPEFVYRHVWNEGDLVIWDNCSAVHRATGDYGPAQRRRMHRTTLKGTVPVGPAMRQHAAE